MAIRTTDGAKKGRWQITAGGEKKTLRCFVSVSVFSIYSKRRCPNTCLADSGVRTRANEPVSARASPVGRRSARKDNPLSVPFLPCIPVVKCRKYGSAEINMTEITAILRINNTALQYSALLMHYTKRDRKRYMLKYSTTGFSEIPSSSEIPCVGCGTARASDGFPW